MALSTFRLPEDDRNYSWTRHVKRKMIFYGLSASLVKRVVRHPGRMEVGIAPGTVAAMQRARTKRPQEYWVMYAEVGKKQDTRNKVQTRKRIITAWRYPGVSPVRERIPIPDDIVRELEKEGEL